MPDDARLPLIRPAGSLPVDQAETRLRCAAGLAPIDHPRHIDVSRSFRATIGGAGVSVQLDQIDGRPSASVSLQLRFMTHDAAEAVLDLLRRRNETNGAMGD